MKSASGYVQGKLEAVEEAVWRIRTASPGGNVFNEGHANVLSHTQVMDGRSDGRHADSSTDGRHTVDQYPPSLSV